MYYREIRPALPLARYVRCFWVLRQSSNSNPDPERIVPDGCCEIIVNRADPFHQLHLNGLVESQPRIMLVGQMAHHMLVAPSGVTDLLGIRFQPGGLHSLLGVPVHEMNERRVELSAIDESLSKRLADAVAVDAEVDIVHVQHVLMGMFRKAEKPFSVAEESVRHIDRSNGRIAIADLGKRLNVTPRHLERRFRREVGLTPKRFARIVRFSQVVHSCQNSGAPDWAELSLACGYYDHAHLIRDFRMFSGQTPSAFVHSHHSFADVFSAGDNTSHFSNTAAC